MRRLAATSGCTAIVLCWLLAGPSPAHGDLVGQSGLLAKVSSGNFKAIDDNPDTRIGLTAIEEALSKGGGCTLSPAEQRKAGVTESDIPALTRYLTTTDGQQMNVVAALFGYRTRVEYAQTLNLIAANGCNSAAVKRVTINLFTLLVRRSKGAPEPQSKPAPAKHATPVRGYSK